MSDILKTARQAIEVEIDGLRKLEKSLNSTFEEAVKLILACKGKVVVTGMGKSGHVGLKIASTLASTGTPSHFLHPAEAIHGDLGFVNQNDIVLAISNSGKTEELIRLLGPLRRIGVSLIAITGNPDSELARRADFHLEASVDKEACILDLAPTASTTAALALGDALAVCLLEQRGFTKEDYALFHPGGNLGKKLITKVSDIMETGENIPVVRESDAVSDVITEIQKKRLGITCVVDDQGVMTGVFSMGDFTRLHLKSGSSNFLNEPISQFMIREPRTIFSEILAARALNTMENHNIRALFVIDTNNRPIGVIGIYEILKAIDY